VEIAAITSVVLAVSLVLLMQAALANARLVEMRADFVSAVTHELKTPLAGLSMVTETLASGRTTRSAEMTREYGQMAAQETKRLARLIDNLLAYARVTDVTEAYTFEPLVVADLVRATLQEFRSRLAHAAFNVVVEVPDDLPPVRGDRTALALLLGNVVDNAIRYSKERRGLRITARATRERVTIEIEDAGVGISGAELPHVTRRFYRGRNTTSGGSGLGLAIAERIAADHGGALVIRSNIGVGTTVSVSLTVARA